MYQPSYLSINNDVEENTLSIWHVTPDDKVINNLLCIHLFLNSDVLFGFVDLLNLEILTNSNIKLSAACLET